MKIRLRFPVQLWCHTIQFPNLIFTKILKYLGLCVHRIIMNLKDLRAKLTVVYLGYLSNVMLMVALALGLYTEWMNSKNTTVLMISLCGLFVFVISCALQYYFNYDAVGKALLHIWLGCILGVIIFNDSAEYQYETFQESMDILLVTSAVFGWFWSICERFLQLKKHEAQLFSSTELLESLGVIIGSLVIGTVDSIAIALCVLAFIMNLTAIRLKSLLATLTLMGLFTVVTFIFIPSLTSIPVATMSVVGETAASRNINIYGLMCFAGRHLFDPIIDLYFSSLSTLERWQAFFSKSGLNRRIIVGLTFILNLVSGAIIGRLSANHKEWFVVVPLFVVFAILWLCFHVLFLITTWKLMNKVTECNLTFNSLSDNNRSMNRIMASKGIRHFSLVSRRIIFLTLITTILLMGVGWETKTNYSMGLIMLLLPIEAVTLSLFWELGDNLGGTCTGYALIAPHTGQRTAWQENGITVSGGGAKLLTAGSVQDMGSRATATLNKIQQFFSFNMIDNYGCDFSSSGITEDYLKSKITQFFDRKTGDGPRYDTYLLYYSGDCHDTGDWALTGDGNLKLDTLIEWWNQKNGSSDSRLILVCDTQHSWRWAQDISKIDDCYIALQTCKFTKTPDPEYGEKFNVGAFTNDWVHYNVNDEVDPLWSDKDRVVRAVYKVSKNWTNFVFHLPTPEDVQEHWESNFPRFTKPLIKGVNFFDTGSLCCCCDGVRQCVKRKRMQWLPPKATDTGHGFKLVRS